MIADHRRDWTPVEKLQFEDVAIEFLNTVEAPRQTYNKFVAWMKYRHPDFMNQADIVWSYVLAN